MESGQDDTVYHEEDLDDDDSQEDEEEYDDDVLGDPEDEEENEASPSVSSVVPVADASTAVTIAVPSSGVSNGVVAPIQSTTATIFVSGSDPKPQHNEEKKPLDDSRRLFQRLWTDEDEIGLLQGFLDYTTQRGSSHHNDTALFYDQIKSKLQLDFNKNQLVEKLRRLKKKYRNVLNKIRSGKEFSFKSPHDQATFEISRKIWSDIGQIGAAVEDNALDDDELNPNPNLNFSHSVVKNEEIVGNSADKKTPSSRKRSRSRSRPGIRADEKRELTDGLVSNKDNTFYNHNNNENSNHNTQGLIEETVRSCLSPLFKDLLTSAMGGPFGGRGFAGLQLNPMPLSFGGSIMNFSSGEMVDEKWRKQQILELEVYSKRLELVQEQIKAALVELRSTGG
ncbi:mediator-associated protein 1 [Quillaja saponaria]|uniref:Mediator-associated protein 1 n=1 Tax=Quillaja saponaria TaxID=32244 RepID=A0AAD7QAU9_QUISA|nr:mediator-associated protein 1 [Quillaja saponaria]